ncbi:hypothetical protein BH11PLA2_BH11PLA2_34600 [soil metagenome]
MTAAADTVVLGFTGKLYVNTGSYSTPVFLECPHFKDGNLNIEANEADVSTRGNGVWMAVANGQKKGSLEFNFLYLKNNAALPTDIQAILTAFLADAAIELFMLDGDHLVAGNQGLRATCVIQKFSRQENLGENMQVSVVAKPTLALNPPSWYVAV